jgi:hypothetical protein
MSKKQVTVQAAPAVDANAFYKVKLGKAAEYLGKKLVPGRDYTLKGVVVEALGEAIVDAKPVA